MSGTQWRPAVETAGSLRFIKPKELAEAGTIGVIAEGTFLKAAASDAYPDAPAFYIQLEDGSTVAINSTGSLRNQMKDVKPGQLVQVIYNGMRTSKSGKSKGKPVHEFRVNIAD